MRLKGKNRTSDDEQENQFDILRDMKEEKVIF
jgi:hypothetical protein